MSHWRASGRTERDERRAQGDAAQPLRRGPDRVDRDEGRRPASVVTRAGPDRSRPGSRCSGRPRAAPRAGPPGSACRTQARPVRPGVEPGERGVDELEMLRRPVAQGEVALLLEDLARGGGLRAVGHLPGRLDRLRDLGEEARALGVAARHGSAAVIEACHADDATLRAGDRRRPRYTPSGVPPRGGSRWPSSDDPVCGMEVDTATALLSTSTRARPTGSAARAACSSSRTTRKYLAEDYRAVDVSSVRAQARQRQISRQLSASSAYCASDGRDRAFLGGVHRRSAGRRPAGGGVRVARLRTHLSTLALVTSPVLAVRHRLRAALGAVSRPVVAPSRGRPRPRS